MYTILNSRGQTLTVIPDRHVDTTATPLALIGFDVTNYGLDHNENFISLLENFANSIAPSNPIEGQFWYNTGNSEMMLYTGSTWIIFGNSSPSLSDNSSENGLAGVYHLAISSPATSVLVYFAGGEVVMIMSPTNLPQSALPASGTANGTSYPISSRFPYGVVAGTTMAQDTANFQYMGNVPLSQQAYFAGGSSITDLPGGWAYADLGNDTVGFMVSNGQIVCAVSQATIANASLPANITVNVLLPNQTTQTTSIPCATVFPSGLIPGLIFAAGASLSDYATQENLSALQTTIDAQFNGPYLVSLINGLNINQGQGIFDTPTGGTGAGAIQIRASSDDGVGLLQFVNDPNTVEYGHFSTDSTGVIKWNGNALLDTATFSSAFTSSLTANGYSYLPNGLLMQWCTVSATVGSFSTYTFPIAFPNACLFCNGTYKDYSISNGGSILDASSVSNTQFRLQWTDVYNSGGTGDSCFVKVFSIGH